MAGIPGTATPALTLMPTTTTIMSPSSSPTNSSNNQQQTGSSSPLLFFVALGFGVVFTNLWIIVGVKYCFRYNQRNRALRAHADGDPIDLTAMPRPHRRRREKKLMTMEEVDTKFPMMKYKAWRASREQEGLPTAGGISVPPSRAASIKDAEGVIGRKSQDASRPLSSLSHALAAISARPNSMTDNEISETRITTNVESTDKTGKATIAEEPVLSEKQIAKQEVKQEQTNVVAASPMVSEEDDDEDIDPIEHAASSEALCAQPGDTCAICLDVLDDDDDVRGLTCGHAFHAACVDPWLSTRRACCPLCKADYYTPKPRPEGEEAAAAANTTGRPNVPLSGQRMNMPQAPPTTWLGTRSRFLLMNVGRNEPNMGRGRPTNQTRQTRRQQPQQPQPQPQPQQTPAPRTGVPNPLRWFRRETPQAPQPTPAQLEAGNPAGNQAGNR